VASAFDHDKSKCIRRNCFGEPVGREHRTLSELFADYAHDGIELYPLAVSNAAGYGYQSVVTFAADNHRGADQVSYLCTLTPRVTANRLGLRRWHDAYRNEWRFV